MNTSEASLQAMNGIPSEIELRDSLMWAQDVMERCSIPFVVLGSAAYQIKNDLPLQVPKIVLGVLENHAVPECTGLLKAVDPTIEITTDGWSMTTGTVKTQVIIIKTKHKTLQDPDVHWYWVEPFRIPNPFDEYWTGNHYDR